VQTSHFMHEMSGRCCDRSKRLSIRPGCPVGILKLARLLGDRALFQVTALCVIMMEGRHPT
jgi:hypothetical protein